MLFFSNLYLKKKGVFTQRSYQYLLFFGIILFQINSSIVPLIKSKIYKVENYQNLFTFKGYYNHYNYPKIKKIVKDNRVISIGVDPMVCCLP